MTQDNKEQVESAKATSTDDQTTAVTTNDSPTTTDTSTSLSQEGATNYASSLADYLKQLQTERERIAKANDPEADRKERRRLARDRMIASIGDALTAMVGIGAAKGYAPVAQTKSNLSDAYKKRYDDFVAMREKSKTAYQAAMQNLDKQDYTTRKVLADLALKYPQAVAAAFRNNALGQKALTDAVNGTALTGARVNNLESGTKLNEVKAETERKRPALIESQINRNNKQGQAAVTNASANQTRAANSGSKKSQGKEDYTQTSETTAVNPVTGQPYQKKTKVTRTYPKGNNKPKGKYSGFSIFTKKNK